MNKLISVLIFCSLIQIATGQHAEPTLYFNAILKDKNTGSVPLQLDSYRSACAESGHTTIRIVLPVNNNDTEIKLTRVPVFRGSGAIRTPSGAIHAVSETLYAYTGYVVGEDHSMVTLVVHDDFFHAVIALTGATYEMHLDKRGYFDMYRSQRSADIVHECHTHHGSESISKPSLITSKSVGDCLEVYAEVDHAAYLDLGASISNAENWVATIMVNVIELYSKVGIPIVVSDVLVWDTPDPYTGNNPLTVLNEFKNGIQNNYNGRVAQLLSTRAIGGGLAEGIGGLCGAFPGTPSPYLVAGDLSPTINNLPSYSSSVQLVAHEIGHVIGSRHTHACVWNGNNTQIDDCGNEYATTTGGFPEGTGCYDVNNPITPVSGTIMSRCELTSTGVDLSLGFHPQVGNLLFQSYQASACSTGSICETVRPGNDDCIGAIPLDIKSTCIPDTYDNFQATSSGSTPGFSCGITGTTVDVWYTVEVPPSGNFTIESTALTGGLTDLVIQLYTGTCGALQQLDCDDNSGVGNHAAISITGLQPGQLVYVRVIDSGSDDEGVYGLCVYDPSIPCHPEISTLVDFYNAMSGPSWLDRSGWEDGALGNNCDVCTWYGVLCDQAGDVIQLDLGSNNLVGNLNLPLDLASLQLLDLADNSISGVLPTWLPDLDSLIVLDVSEALLSGNLPATYGSMDNLQVIYLDGNDLTGPLPETWATDLSLNALDLSDNNLSGCIPTAYTNLCASAVDLSNNSSLSNDDFATFCSDMIGGDFDGDGFCSGTGPDRDCRDMDIDSYPGAPELCDGYDNDCDGTADEGVSVVATWTGGSGMWATPSSWSTGSTPTACTDVIINGSSMVTVDLQTVAVARSVTVDGNGTLDLDGRLIVRGATSDGVEVVGNGTLLINGPLYIYDSGDYGIAIEANCTQSDSLVVAGSVGLAHYIASPSATITKTTTGVVVLGGGS